MAQTFMTYEQQLNKLQFEKGLTISDFETAYKTLEEFSYYSLISGYKKLFLHPASKNYKHGVTFDEIVNFYHFDEHLRNLFLTYILQIERHIKSMISYYFCEQHGEFQSEYLNPKNFDYKQHPKEVKKLINSMKRTITITSHYKYITYHAHKYHNVPLWVAVNAMTMGQISAFYQYLTNDIQVKISKNYPRYTEKQLHQFITIIAKCRNVCAHGERLYDFRTSDMIPNTLLHKKLSITQKKGAYTQGKNDLFSVVIALCYLLPDSEFGKFYHSLKILINRLLVQCPHLSENQLFQEMGFPMNWVKIKRFKK